MWLYNLELPSQKLYSFVLHDDLRIALKRVKEKDGVPESEQIRRALRAWLRRRGVLKKKAPRKAGRGSKNPRKSR